MKRLIAFLSLFTSVSTLFCCALPALLVFLGAGSVLAAISASFPSLIALSKYKTLLFFLTAVLLVLGFVSLRNKQECDINTVQKEACQDSKKVTKWILYMATVLFAIGFFMAYGASFLI